MDKCSHPLKKVIAHYTTPLHVDHIIMILNIRKEVFKGTVKTQISSGTCTEHNMLSANSIKFHLPISQTLENTLNSSCANSY